MPIATVLNSWIEYQVAVDAMNCPVEAPLVQEEMIKPLITYLEVDGSRLALYKCDVVIESRCDTPPPPPVINLSVSWSIPVARQGGTPLSLADISGYQLCWYSLEHLIAECKIIPSATQVEDTVTVDKAGEYSFTIITLSHDGKPSAMSQQVEVAVE